MSERLRVCLQEGDEVLSYALTATESDRFFYSEISLCRLKQSQGSVFTAREKLSYIHVHVPPLPLPPPPPPTGSRCCVEMVYNRERVMKGMHSLLYVQLYNS